MWRLKIIIWNFDIGKYCFHALYHEKCLFQLRKYLLICLVFFGGMCLFVPFSCCIYVPFERKKEKKDN